ncbi:MAG: ATP synthase F1 subunit delta [Oscillospiraceae bacterium]|nr:ATP synthase F1 subunit delta [Oscillospiraceae bacterium]
MMKNYANEYGLALYNLGIEAGCSKAIFEDFKSVAEVFDAQPEFSRLLSNPMLTASERADAVRLVFGGKINGYLLNMLMIFAEKRRFDMLSKCWLEYRRNYCKANNILPVTATSVQPLTDEQKTKLISKLKVKTGKQILLTCVVNPKCLGGIMLEYDGKRIDASVKQRFSDMRQLLRQSDLSPKSGS